MFLCPLCGSAQGNDRNTLLRHISVAHAGDSSFHIVCGINGCARTFRTFCSFRCHLYRDHSSDFQCNAVMQDFGEIIICSACGIVVDGVRELNAHLRQHMDLDQEVECPYELCNAKYSVYTSFTSHVSRYHRAEMIINLKKSCKRQVAPCSGVDQSRQDDHVPVDVEGNGSGTDTNYSRSESEDALNHCYAAFLLKLQEKYLLPVSTMQSITEDLAHLTELSTVDTREKVSAVLAKHSVDQGAISEVEAQFKMALDNGINCKLQTNCKRMTYYKTYFPYVEPVKYNYGVNAFGKQCTFQYVPVLDSLGMLLQCSDVHDQVFHPYTLHEKYVEDFVQGTNYREHDFFRNHRKHLSLILYFDEFEVANPLGCNKKKHKIGAVYFILGNLHPSCRSNLAVIQLVLLARSVDIKQFGFDRLLLPLVSDIDVLATEGIALPDSNERLFGTVFAVVSDNLGSHMLGGFKESFSGFRVCRHCMATGEQIQSCFDVSSFTSRSKENYDAHVEMVAEHPTLSTSYGVQRKSALNSIRYFHVTRGLPPDIMHDILEGVGKYEMALVVQNFVSRGLLTITWLNAKIETWKFGELDARSKPVAFPVDLKDTLNQSASRMWCLIRLLPLMLSDKIPLGDHYMELLLVLKDIVEIVFSPKLSLEHVAYLEFLILSHHQLFAELFPDRRFKPKQHYLIHYPDLFLQYGPLIHFWSMRFEAKHGYFKSLVSTLRNFKDITGLLARRHQLLQASLQVDHHILRPDVDVGAVDVSCISTFSTAVQILIHKSVRDSPTVQHSDHVKVNGTSYSTGMVVVVGVTDSGPVFGVINMILVSATREVHFLVRIQLAQYCPELRAYSVKSQSVLELIDVSCLIDYYPLSMYEVQNEQFVVLKHVICG
jgi:hypothetical protein